MVSKFSIDLLQKFHDKKSFSCGIDELDNYLYRQASQDERRSLAVVYVLHDNTDKIIAGYYTLSSTAIELAALPEELSKKLPRYNVIPATLLGRLAIDAKYQGQQLGEVLLMDALDRSYNTSRKNVASYAVVVDAINDNAINFYTKYGFHPLTKNKLFLPMKTIEKLLTDS
ncbi:MAG: GNAT family N-acetyltransferase [Legionellales bacterium]|nr:GNAT family N-acetyltransferase [Legionellales bacterium]